jgi:foldase protein PrsA
VNISGGLRRAGVSAVMAALAAVAASGCGGQTTSPGAAALVGEERISVETLQHTVDAALADPAAQASIGDDRAKFTRTELGRLISNLIVASAAAAHGIAVTTSELDDQVQSFAQQAGGMDQLLQQAAGQGIPGNELRSFIRYYVLQNKLADALVADTPVSQAELQKAYDANLDQYDQVHSAHILVDDKKTADSILAQVRRNPSRFAALAARFSTDTSNKDNGGDLGFAGRGQFVAPFSDAIFAAKPDTFLEVHTEFGWHVVHVIERKRTSLAEATPELKTNLLQQTRDRLLSETLSAEARRLGIHVNPRFGRWDGRQGAVVPLSGRDAVSSPSPAA